MPVVSDAQRRAMYAAREGHSTLGIPQKVGAEFIEASHGITGLPKRKKQHGARSGLPGHIAAIAPLIAHAASIQYGPSASKRHIPQTGARMQQHMVHPQWGRLSV